MYFHENDSIKGLLGDRLLNMRSLNSGFKTTCTEVYAIAVFDILYSLVSVFIDEHNRTIEGGSGHFCDKHDIFLDFLFGGDSLLLSTFFSVSLFSIVIDIYGKAKRREFYKSRIKMWCCSK